jgi:hypothetical protein
MVLTHPDGSLLQGIFEFGIREFETQVPSGNDLLNLVDKQILHHPNPLLFTPVLHFNGDDFNPTYTLDPVALDIDLGQIDPGDTMSWVYTLTAQGTTHGFERGYFAFLGDPFGGELTSGNLEETTSAFAGDNPIEIIGGSTAVPESSPFALVLLGLAALLVERKAGSLPCHLRR